MMRWQCPSFLVPAQPGAAQVPNRDVRVRPYGDDGDDQPSPAKSGYNRSTTASRAKSPSNPRALKVGLTQRAQVPAG